MTACARRRPRTGAAAYDDRGRVPQSVLAAFQEVEDGLARILESEARVQDAAVQPPSAPPTSRAISTRRRRQLHRRRDRSDDRPRERAERGRRARPTARRERPAVTPSAANGPPLISRRPKISAPEASVHRGFARLSESSGRTGQSAASIERCNTPHRSSAGQAVIQITPTIPPQIGSAWFLTGSNARDRSPFDRPWRPRGTLGSRLRLRTFRRD